MINAPLINFVSNSNNTNTMPNDLVPITGTPKSGEEIFANQGKELDFSPLFLAVELAFKLDSDTAG